MNYKRAIGFGLMLWVLIFVTVTIVMFLPFFENKEMTQYLINWVLLIPITLGLAKWYFREVNPTVLGGFKLWVVGLIAGTILDLIITVPFFVKSYSAFYGDWRLYVGFGITLVLLLFAGGEFDTMNWKKEMDNKE